VTKRCGRVGPGTKNKNVTSHAPPDFKHLSDALVGSILGTAVGDAIGLPYEGLSRRRARKMLGPPDRQRLFFRRGMISDDTEQTCLVAQALIEAYGAGQFQSRLLSRLRGWFLTLPGGVGLGTLRALLKSLIGFPPDRCGVYSAGNGPSMRSAILGVAIQDRKLLMQLVQESCTLTHTDPKALWGAWSVALAANLAARTSVVDPNDFLAEMRQSLCEPRAEELLQLLDASTRSVHQGQSTLDFAISCGMVRGVSGYVYHTVPIAVHAWLANQTDYRKAVTSVVECGGDTDTTGAIVGGIVGAHVGKAGIPEEWIETILEWPRTLTWMEELAGQLARVVESGRPESPLSVPVAAVLARNAAFLAIVLAHGFRRLFPPY
jgi:ADP-ribosyl-[dinitrogen reductase] hydrolase